MSYPPQPYFPPAQQPYYPPQPSPWPAQPPVPYQPPPSYQAPPEQHQQAPAAPPLARGTIDDFYEQPAGGGGKSISFDRKPPGTTYAGVVVRTLTNADIQPQTDIRDRNRIMTHPDGRPKLVMIIPLQLQPSAEFPDGRAAWYVKGADRTELERAMEAAGVKPGTAPEAGAVISITYVGERPIPGLNPQKVKQVTYRSPNGNGQQPVASQHQSANVSEPQYQQPAAVPAVPTSVPQYQQQPQYAQAPPQQPYPPAQYPPQYAAPAAAEPLPATIGQYEQQQQYAPPAAQPVQPTADPQQYAQAPPATPAQAPAQSPLAPPPDLSPDQQALLARLTGQ